MFKAQGDGSEGRGFHRSIFQFLSGFSCFHSDLRIGLVGFLLDFKD